MSCVWCLDLPEWSTDDVDDIGTFDSSGAFMSLKVSLCTSFLSPEQSMHCIALLCCIVKPDFKCTRDVICCWQPWLGNTFGQE